MSPSIIVYSGKLLVRSPIELNTCMPMAVSIQIAKFKLCQYQRRAIWNAYQNYLLWYLSVTKVNYTLI